MANSNPTSSAGSKVKNFFQMLFRYKHTRAWFIVFTVMLAVIIAVSCVINCLPLISVTLDNVFGGQTLKLSGPTEDYQYYSLTDAEESKTLEYYDPLDQGVGNKAEVLSAANDLNETICEEGFVLLKNEGNALPIATSVSDASVKENPRVTVFGKSSVNLVYGSTGSAGSDHTGAKSIYDSLSAAGFVYNPTMKSFYEDNSASGAGRNDNGDMEQGVSVGLAHGETPWSSYTSKQTSSYQNDYNDAAIVVFSRTAGEGWDLPRTMIKAGSSSVDDLNRVDGAYSASDHYLELDKYEMEMLVNVCNSFDKVIVLINSAAPMELGFLDGTDDNDSSVVSGMNEVHSKIQAALWIGLPGNTGIMALGRVLNGQVNPSGSLVDTYERQMDLSPTWQNFSTNFDDNVENGLGDEYVYSTNGARSNYYYVDYEEGIYVGYRYYETAYYENRNGNYDGFNYDSQVVYPFGYGLSYSEFEWEIVEDGTTSAITAEMLEADTDITIQVKVTNKSTSKYAGKDTVQVYLTAPYTEGGIEKAHVVLAGYAKTGLIEPGKSDTVTITISPYSLASYDFDDANANGHKGYELDAGDYVLTIAQNSHEAAVGGSDVLKKTYGLTETNDGKGIAYNYDSDPDGAEGNTVTNQFDDVSTGSVDSTGKNISERTMSRTDFKSTFPTTPTLEDRKVDTDYLDTLYWSWSGRNDEDYDYYTEEMPTFAESADEKTAIQLYELIGLDWDNELWDDFLDQLTVEEMSQLIGMGCYSTIANLRIGLPSTTSGDGPVGLVNFFTNMVQLGQRGTVYDVCSYASVCLVGATFNDRLAYEQGVAVGNECLVGNEAGDGKPYTGWYAPAVNIHRSPFSGRNSEYYSEDGLLSGKLAAQVVQGATSKGVTTMVKHFAVNDQETHRQSNGICVWVNEQAMREVYLKPFRLTVTEGETVGMMTSFNRLGTTWAGGSYALLTEVLRNEWGFCGMVITDFNTANTTYMNVDQMIRAGGDLDLAQDKQPSLVDQKGNSRLTATQASLIRQAAHNILYTLANSNIMNGIGEGVTLGMGLSPWQKVNVWIAVGLTVALLAWGAAAITLTYKKEKQRLANADAGEASGEPLPEEGAQPEQEGEDKQE